MLATARFLSDRDRILPGVVQPVIVGTLATGAEISATPTGGEMWKILGGTAAFVASAAVATRTPVVQVMIGGVQVWEVATDLNATANGTALLQFQRMGVIVPSDANTFRFQAPIPDVWLSAGDVIRTQTRNLQAGDQWQAVQFAVEVFYASNEELSELQEERYEYAMAAEQRRQG